MGGWRVEDLLPSYYSYRVLLTRSSLRLLGLQESSGFRAHRVRSLNDQNSGLVSVVLVT